MPMRIHMLISRALLAQLPPHRHSPELRWRRCEPGDDRVGNILVCDDERWSCELLDIALRRDGHKVETVTGGDLAKRKIDSALFEVIVTDIKMPGVDGVEVLRHAHQISPESAVILMTAVDDYEAAVQAVKAGGAAAYIRKSPGLGDEGKLANARPPPEISLSPPDFSLRRC